LRVLVGEEELGSRWRIPQRQQAHRLRDRKRTADDGPRPGFHREALFVALRQCNNHGAFCFNRRTTAGQTPAVCTSKDDDRNRLSFSTVYLTLTQSQCCRDWQRQSKNSGSPRCLSPFTPPEPALRQPAAGPTPRAACLLDQFGLVCSNGACRSMLRCGLPRA